MWLFNQYRRQNFQTFYNSLKIYVKKINRVSKFSKTQISLITLAVVLVYVATLGYNNPLILQNQATPTRGVIVTLIRSTNRSIFLTINMIHSIIQFYPTNNSYLYPFIIFYDENFTSVMRHQILSCVLKPKKKLQISFEFVSFKTKVKIDPGSRLEKRIEYRLMCRFWTYDVFYHPAIRGKYEYLMRMDDDSYFMEKIKIDILHYIDNQKLDYIYRSVYGESITPMVSIIQRFLNKSSLRLSCIYNNFFVIRLKWYYESKQVQSFVRELIRDDLMLRQYIGDGCVHSAMLEIDKLVRVQHVTDISYGHNFHLMPSGRQHWSFHAHSAFYEEIKKAYFYRRLIYICFIIYLLFWFIKFRFRSLSISTTQLDIFLNSTLCGRLIRYPNIILTESERLQLDEEASSFFSYSKDCSLFERSVKISSEELTYPLAFTILIHTNLDQFDFILRTIYHRYNYYCIHVDLKSPLSLYQAIENRVKCVSNIYLPEKRINVTWGSFSVLEAEHLCQKELLKQSLTWKYYFNLANTDLPLKTNFELVQILKLYNNQNDITSLPYRSYLRQKKILSNRTLPSTISLPFYKGEFHVLLSRSTVEYIHKNSRVMDLYNFLNGTSVPDEHFYSMINRWKETPGFYPYDHDLSQITFMTRYKIWGDRPEYHLCHGGFVRSICVFNYQDLWHVATSPHFFANKIFFQRDRLIPYCMAQYLDIRTNMIQEKTNFSMIEHDFYKQLNNVRYGKEKL
ncbi:unnamed protein product [Rotaria sp. Silwood1]|nr:unnamed protein product [Rotaria sp. Silwood1]CAF1003673.1 unnamed protein product [Rotaria sp. Silwood1]CAF3421229.1 unnamed protein product [Rotaria sp. Silwood1]CAF3423229.1 unnamed protein product [Rotaria sp. Silwood1]CAF4775147.1 unnamed protein product [Rotaria sp. Silwood1]